LLLLIGTNKAHPHDVSIRAFCVLCQKSASLARLESPTRTLFAQASIYSKSPTPRRFRVHQSRHYCKDCVCVGVLSSNFRVEVCISKIYPVNVVVEHRVSTARTGVFFGTRWLVSLQHRAREPSTTRNAFRLGLYRRRVQQDKRHMPRLSWTGRRTLRHCSTLQARHGRPLVECWLYLGTEQNNPHQEIGREKERASCMGLDTPHLHEHKELTETRSFRANCPALGARPRRVCRSRVLDAITLIQSIGKGTTWSLLT
jgi:hypothetical protein